MSTAWDAIKYLQELKAIADPQVRAVKGRLLGISEDVLWAMLKAIEEDKRIGR